MVCAQALALVARAAARLAAGQALRICYNAEDVRRDLTAWARERGYALEAETSATLDLRRER